MNNITGNESAFPKVKTTRDDSTLNGKQYVYGNTFSVGGMTLRQYYAGLAMQGMLANPECYKVLLKNVHPDNAADFYSVASVEQADSLINELNKNQTE